jgi:hypothetical protein
VTRAGLLIVTLASASLASFACKSEKPQAMQAPSATFENPYTIEDDDVPVAPDFEEEAQKAITPENVEAEVAKMEKELE